MGEEHMDTMYYVSTRLTKEESQDLALLYQLPPRLQDERAFKVLLELEKQQYILAGKPETLESVVKRINRLDLATEVRKRANNEKKIKRGKRKVVQKPPQELPLKSSAKCALARLQLEQTEGVMKKLLSDLNDPDISDALDLLTKCNKCLSRAERRHGLPTTREYSDDDSQSSHSSPSSDSGQEDLYEPLNYVRPQSEVGTERTSPETVIKCRPPLPAPKPNRKPKSESQAVSSGTITQPKCGIPLPGLAPFTNTMPHCQESSSASPRVVVAEGEECQEGTGDSGVGTGSDYGFSDPKPFLKRPVVPKKPLVASKSLCSTQIDLQPRYMSLTGNVVLTDEYTKLRQKAEGLNAEDSKIYDVPRR